VANITIVGIKESPQSACDFLGCESVSTDSVTLVHAENSSTVLISSLEKTTSAVWSGNFILQLFY
jgi:hypothetical protein